MRTFFRSRVLTHPGVLNKWGIGLCLVIMGINLVASQGTHHPHSMSNQTTQTSLTTPVLSSASTITGTFRGTANGPTDTPQPIPDTALTHCVLFSILGNDFDPCFWILKAVVGTINWFLNWITDLLQGFVTGLLSHDILFDTPTSVTTENDAVIALVNDMRWIANAALILMAMVGGFNIMIRPHVGLPYHDVAEFFPRYVMGAIGANLSLWFLAQLVDASNLYMHFIGAAPLFTPQLTNLPPGANALAVVFFGTLAIIFYLIMLLLLILQIFVRLALLDFLIILSPLAIVCWILPQTQRATEWWAGLMGSTLVLQPLQLTMISLGVTLATNIPLKDGLWGFDTVLLQLCLLIATFYLCFRLPALLNYGLFRTVGGVGSGMQALGAAAQLGVAMATGNPGIALGAVGGGGGGGGTTVTPVSPLSSTVGSGAPGLSGPSGGGGSSGTGGNSGGSGAGGGNGGLPPAPNGGGGFGGYLPAPNGGSAMASSAGSATGSASASSPSTAPSLGTTGNDGNTTFADDPGTTGSQSTTTPPRQRPGEGHIIDGSGWTIHDDAGPLV